ncbi:MAG: C-GCAxxG-C-C family protein [Proteobacteria bacterium]|nr:C-GCAxxG-C-C family protein [Pseudomonadota bacterium]
MNNPERAVSCFKETFSCSQAILSTYGPELGLEKETALKVAGAFGGGMARMGEVCGAVTGAFIVIGLKHGKIKAEDEEAKEKTYLIVREFVERFKSRNGSIKCRELLGYDISTLGGIKLIKEKNLFYTICVKYVRDAAEIIEELLH